MKRYSITVSILVPLAFLALIAIAIFILFNTGSDLAITIILIFIPAMIGVSFLVRYLVAVRKRSVREQVMERDIRAIANRYMEEMRILRDFEEKYRISTKEFRTDLEKVKDGLSELGCKITGQLRMNSAQLRRVVFADVEWVDKMLHEITERHEMVLCSRLKDRCNEYLIALRELRKVGLDISPQIEQMEKKLEDMGMDIEMELLELAMFMNEVVSLIEESLWICVKSAMELEAIARERVNADTARVRTDIKLAEHSIEHGNYDNAVELLKNVVVQLSAMLSDEFERYKADVLVLAGVAAEISDDAEVKELKDRIEGCMLPSQMPKLLGYGKSLMELTVALLEKLYKQIFELETEIQAENPGTDAYPVEYWSRDKLSEIEELRAIAKEESTDVFVRRYRLLASDALSRLSYDSERLKYIRSDSARSQN